MIIIGIDAHTRGSCEAIGRVRKVRVRGIPEPGLLSWHFDESR